MIRIEYYNAITSPPLSHKFKIVGEGRAHSFSTFIARKYLATDTIPLPIAGKFLGHPTLHRKTLSGVSVGSFFGIGSSGLD